MKQTIRIETFETNSSSYHSISVSRKSLKEKEKPLEVEVGKETVVDGIICYKTIGYTESYTYTSRTKLDKINMLARYISAEMEERIYDMEEYDEYVGSENDNDKKRERKRELAQKHPLLSAFVKAIQNYTNAPVVLKFGSKSRWDDLFEPIWAEATSLDDVLNIHREDLDNEEVLIEAYTKIIFDDDIEITEECESNE